MKLVFGQIEVVAVQLSDIFWECLNAISSQKDAFQFRQTSNIAFAQFQLIKIQADFLQAVEFHNPAWDMTNLVALQIEIFQMLATTDTGWNVCQLAVCQVQAFDVVVFGKVDFAKTASVEGDNLQTVRQKQGLVHPIRFDTRKSGNPHLIVYG